MSLHALVLIHALLAASNAPVEACCVRLALPIGWQVVSEELETDGCTAGFRAPDGDERFFDAVIHVSGAGWDAELEHAAIRWTEDNVYEIVGNNGYGEAHERPDLLYRTIIAEEVPSRCWDDEHRNVLCELPLAVVSDGKNAATLHLFKSIWDVDFEAIVRSMRFVQ